MSKSPDDILPNIEVVDEDDTTTSAVPSLRRVLAHPPPGLGLLAHNAGGDTPMTISDDAATPVDHDGDIWVVNRPNSLHSMDVGSLESPPISLCCKPLKEVIEFSYDGEVKRNWNGRETAPIIDGEIQYPSNIHGIYILSLIHI